MRGAPAGLPFGSLPSTQYRCRLARTVSVGGGGVGVAVALGMGVGNGLGVSLADGGGVAAGAKNVGRGVSLGPDGRTRRVGTKSGGIEGAQPAQASANKVSASKAGASKA